MKPTFHLTLLAILFLMNPISSEAAPTAQWCEVELKDFSEPMSRIKSAEMLAEFKTILAKKKYRISKYPKYSIDFDKISWKNDSGVTFGEGYQFKIRDLKSHRILSESNSYLRIVRSGSVLTGKRRQFATSRKILGAIRNLKRCSALSKR